MATFDITGDDIQALISDSENLLKEQAEFHADRAEQNRIEQQTVAQQLELATQRVQQTQATNDEMLQVLGEMEGDFKRIDEISNSFTLQLAEAVGFGDFNPEFSRKKLTKQLEMGQTKLGMIQTKDQLNQSVVDQKNAMLNTQALQAKLKTAKSADEVNAIAETLNTKLEARDRVRTMKTIAMSSAEEPALQKMLADKQITQREFDMEMQVRKDEKYKARAQEFQMLFNEHQAMGIKLQSAPIESLRDGTFAQANPDVPMRAINDEIRRENQHRVAEQQLNLLWNQQQRAEKLQTAQDTDLQKMADKGDVLAGEELAGRKDKQAAREERIASANARAKQAEEVIKLSWLDSLKEQDALEYFNASLTSGQVFTIPGTNTTVTSQQLRDVTKRHELVRVEQAELAAGSQMIDSTISRNLDNILRAYGLPYDPQASAQDKLKIIMQNSTIAPEDQDAAEEMYSRLQLDPTITPANVVVDQRSKVATTVSKMRERVEQQRVAAFPAPMQDAARDFIRSGQISRNQDAVTVLTSASLFSEVSPILNPRYSQAGKVLLEAGNSLGMRAMNSEENAAGLASILPSSTTNPTDSIAAAALKEETQRAMAKPIIDGAMMETHITTATQMGNLNLAEQLRTNKDFRNASGQFDQSLFFKFLAENSKALGFDTATYLSQYRKALPNVIQRITSTQNADGLQIAAFNKLLFGNDVLATITHEIEVGEGGIVRSQRAYEEFARRRQVVLPGGVMVQGDTFR